MEELFAVGAACVIEALSPPKYHVRMRGGTGERREEKGGRAYLATLNDGADHAGTETALRADGGEIGHY